MTSHEEAEPDVELLPTHVAAARNNVEELERLVAKGEPLEAENGETPLHAAARTGSKDTLRWLLVEGAVSPLAKAKNENTAAHYAAVYGHLGALKLLTMHDTSMGKKMIAEKDENGLTILSLAALQGDDEMVSWVLDTFADVANVPNGNGNLAVHFSASSGFLRILKLLVRKYGRDIAESQDDHNTKPVYFASQEGKLDILDYLINDLEADGIARDKSGMSTVHAATQGGQTKAVKWLVKKLGLKFILDKTIDGATPLHMAAALGHCDILTFLVEHLENKGDIDALDHIHATAAHDAAEFGQMEALLVLLEHGANVGIKDSEDKTPYDLASEHKHTAVMRMLADFSEHGPAVLSKYHKKKKKEDAHTKKPPPTNPGLRSREAEVSEAIVQANEIIEQRKDDHLRRQSSLQRMNEAVEREARHLITCTSPSDEEDEGNHMRLPNGDVYARPKKRHGKKAGSHHGSDIDDYMSETVSQHSFGMGRGPTQLDTLLPLDDRQFSRRPNLETASNFSRPSRVRQYADQESVSSFNSGYRGGRHNVPGFHPHTQPPQPPQPFHYLPPPPHIRRGPRSISGSSMHSSQGGRSRAGGGYHVPPNMPYPSYAMPPGMVYYAYPAYPPGYRPKTTKERMHMAALQRARPVYPPGYQAPPPGAFAHGRRSALATKKDTVPLHSAGPTRDRTEKDIGYGPPVSPSKQSNAGEDQPDLHPQPPPVSRKDGSVSTGQDVVKFDGNFIIARKRDSSDARLVGGTTLNPIRGTPVHYDGRWDEYIMTDSEEEREPHEDCNVALAVEAATIIAIACVAGLPKVTKKSKKKVLDSSLGHPSISTAWDDAEPEGKENHKKKKKKKKSKKGALEDPKLNDLSPGDFAAHEEGANVWSWGHGTEEVDVAPRDETEVLYPSAIDPEAHRHGQASVSKQLGMKILSESLGARNSSMLDIASATVGSRMSTAHDSDEEAESEPDLGPVLALDRKSRSEDLEPAARTADSQTGSKKKDKQTKKEEKKQKKEEKKKEKQAAKDKKPKKVKKETQHLRLEQAVHKDKEVTPAEKPSGKAKKPKGGRKLTVQPASPEEDEKHLESRRQDASVAKATASPTKRDRAAEEYTTSVSVPVKPAPAHEGRQAGSFREVDNHLSFLDSEEGDRDGTAGRHSTGLSEVERIEENVTSMADELQQLLDEAPAYTHSPYSGRPARHAPPPPARHTPPKPVRHAPPPPAPKVDLIEMDDASREIFGVEGLAELNDALRQLNSIQSGLDFSDSTPSKPSSDPSTGAKSANMNSAAGVKASVKTTGVTRPSVKGAGVRGAGVRGAGVRAATQRSQYENKEISLTFVDDSSHSSGSFPALWQPQATPPRQASDGSEGAGLQAEALQQIMDSLRALDDSVRQIRASPSEIQHQQEIQQHLIQNVLAYCQNDPELTSKLLSLLHNTQQGPMETLGSTELEQNLLQAQEKQFQETKEHFRTQAEFQASIQLKLDQQAELQMKGMHSTFEKYQKMMEEQMSRQQERWEEEMKRRDEEQSRKQKRKEKKDKKKRKRHRHRGSDSDSTSNESDNGMKYSQGSVPIRPAVKTMEATIHRQDLLESESAPEEMLPEPPPLPSVTSLLEKGKDHMGERKRRGTHYSFTQATDALRRLQSDEEEEEGDTSFQFAHAQPVSVRKADIKVQHHEVESYTPYRTQSLSQKVVAVGNGVQEEPYTEFHMIKRREPKFLEEQRKQEQYDSASIKFGQTHVETNKHKVPPRENPLAGAGDELKAALLKARQITT